MTVTTPNASPNSAQSVMWPAVAIALLLAAQATLVFTRAINWDEFFFYSQVHQFLRGEALPPFNTIHVHLFTWLPAVADNGVDAIVIARIVMLLCELVTMGAIYAIGVRLADRTSALIAVLAYISAGFVLQHGFSFRVDPIVTAALMTGLAILVTARLSIIAIAGFALIAGFAGMVTIKAILFAPAVAGVALWRWSESDFDRRMALRLMACFAGAIVVCALLYLYHSGQLARSLASGGFDGVEARGDGMLRSAGTSVFFLGVPPYIQMVQKGLWTAPLLALLVVTAPIAILRNRDGGVWRKVLFLGFWLPILTLAFYRNTAPYYYAFMLAPVVLGTLPAIAVLRRHASAPILAIAFLLPAAVVLLKEDRAVIDNQRALVVTASLLFDEPVDYFDHNGMIAGYRKANGFMTPWGLEGYRAHGQSMFRTIMETRTVPLLVENDELLVDLLRGSTSAENLYPEDSRVLRDNYVPVWGAIWLAGKEIAGGSSISTEILVPGTYRVEGGDLAIDGAAVATGSTVHLERGEHKIANTSDRTARIVWADVDKLPTAPAPDGRLWIGF
ncbi:hypothetical protein EKN06_13165 [Croceicoccus ponticola]|uniref:Glycosyltransferase RgtA/B/C/D-like domain-containing protein n=1 Tax=Croceicoccus ponticola TaxID=2217664 RepID=A0A437GUY6_9SPHN|nr:hypothetical protein [Croceicoccus ponticola]RVQ65481.1 hypothetical protein EKN06_13165 [Croceicoccus ponticola]